MIGFPPHYPSHARKVCFYLHRYYEELKILLKSQIFTRNSNIPTVLKMEASLISSSNQENIDKKCRTCLKIEENMESIFEVRLDNQQNPNFLEIFKIISSIEVSKTDGGPDKICQICITKTNEAFQFRRQCIEADNSFKKVSIKEEPTDDFSEIVANDCQDSDEQDTIKRKLRKHPPRPRKFKCNICCKLFHTPYNLKR